VEEEEVYTVDQPSAFTFTTYTETGNSDSNDIKNVLFTPSFILMGFEASDESHF